LADRTSARILVTGADGQVGRQLVELARAQGRDVHGHGRASWDIADPGAAQRHIRAGDVVINCAALTNVDAAENDPDRADELNHHAPGIIAAACARAGAGLIHLSTDYVFGGGAGRSVPYEPDEPTDPLSVYGRTKLAGEQAAHAALPDAVIARTSWVFTGVGTDFVAAMRTKAAGADPVSVVADQVGTPTYSRDLAAALLVLADHPPSIPVVHVANAEPASRYELAQAVFAGVGCDIGRVTPVDTAAFPRPAARPLYSALGQRLSTSAGVPALRPWRAALAEALA